MHARYKASGPSFRCGQDPKFAGVPLSQEFRLAGIAYQPAKGRPSDLAYHRLDGSGTGSRRSYGHLPNLSGDGYHLVLCDGLLQLPRVQWVWPKKRPAVRWMRRQRTLRMLHMQRLQAETVPRWLAQQM